MLASGRPGEHSSRLRKSGFAPSRRIDVPYGRLFELKNPTDAPGITEPLTPTSNNGADFVHQNVIPRTSHEGIQFDKDGNMYFIDELNGGNVYKYTSAAKCGDVMCGKAEYFAAGQTFVLRVGNGNTPNAIGPYTWVPFTDADGDALPGALTITDPRGVTSVDARNTTDLALFKGTDYQRPEDLQIQTVKGGEYLYMATTTTNQVYRLDLKNNTIAVFANRSTINLATGLAVGSALASPDNLAIDHDGNIYIVEDRNGGVDDDIWFARDLNGDGDLLDPGEGLGRWASNGTVGSEFTGLYFDPTDKRRAWVNIQHPDSGNDRTIEITIPELWLWISQFRIARHYGHLIGARHRQADPPRRPSASIFAGTLCRVPAWSAGSTGCRLVLPAPCRCPPRRRRRPRRRRIGRRLR